MTIRMLKITTLLFICMAITVSCSESGNTGIQQTDSDLTDTLVESEVFDPADTNNSYSPDDILSPDLTIEELKEFNPKMIEIWLGELTKEDWCLRFGVEDWRLRPLHSGINCFFALYDRCPSDLEELHDIGFFPISGLDPVTGTPYNLGPFPEHDEDFINIGLVTSDESWEFTYQIHSTPRFNTDLVHSEENWENTDQQPEAPEINWVNGFRKKICGTIPYWEESNYFDELKAKYPSQSAMRGVLLARILNTMLKFYEYRRNEMPENSDELLDGLWQVQESWAQNNSSCNLKDNNSFCFGLDYDLQFAVAVWRDENGDFYTTSYGYDLGNDDGWDKIPSLRQFMRHNSRPMVGGEIPYIHDRITLDYIPEIILWSCSLNID